MMRVEPDPLFILKKCTLGKARGILYDYFHFCYLDESPEWELIKKDIKEIEPVTLLQALQTPNFFTKDYKGAYAYINKSLIKAASIRGKESAEKIAMMLKASAMGAIFQKYKQVYELDSVFASDLIMTERLKIYPSIIRRLPYDSFYVNVDNIEELSPYKAKGFLLYLKVEDDGTFLVHILLSRLGRRSFQVFNLRFPKTKQNTDEKGYVYYDLKNMSMEKNKKNFLSSEEKLSQTSHVSFFTMFVMQLLAYLSSQKPDIEEAKFLEKEYRVQGQKDKTSNIQKWDVGIRYGAKIRKYLNEKNNEEKLIKTEIVLHANRKPPRPHSRCAHWHHYWTGAGRKVLELKWIEPTYVGAKDKIIVVKHKVTN